jgi:hypothetical protein
MKGSQHVKRIFKAAAAGAVTTAFAGMGLLAVLSAPSAFAAATGTAPPYLPDADVAAPYANLEFFNSSGAQVVGGSCTTTACVPFAFAASTTSDGLPGETSAQIYYASPQSTSPPSGWNQSIQGANFTYSTASFPGTGLPALKTAGDSIGSPGASGDFNTFLASHAQSATAGYANTIQVRLYDTTNFGTLVYWESDIAFNMTGSPITVDNNSIPANSWAQVFPIVATTTTTATATPATVQTGNAIALTATVTDPGTPDTCPGGVSFSYSLNGGAATAVGGTVSGPGGAAGDQYTDSFTPTTPGSYAFTAHYGDSVGSECYSGNQPIAGNPGPAVPTSATFNAPSTDTASSAVTVTPPLIGTTVTGLSANPTSINFGQTDALTATVQGSDNLTAGVAGSFEFFQGGVPIAGCTATATVVTGAGTTASPGVGTSTCNTTGLAQGTDTITATFTPSSNAYSGSSSTQTVTVTVAAPQACTNTGSSCSDTQNIQVTINPGTITITTPYTASNPFVLPAMTLSTDGTYLQTSATFPAAANPAAQQIVVTSALSPAYAWTLSVSGTALSDGHGHTIPSSGLGLTSGALLNATGPGAYPGTVTFVPGGIPAHNPSPVDTDTHTGLTGTPQTWATSSAADGTAEMDGLLTLFAATSTPSGTYNGTITFSVS